MLSRPLLLDIQEKVSTLIDSGRHCWSQELIDANFFPREAALMKAIPLSFNVCADVMTWPLNMDGVYSVRSGYHLLLDMELNEQPRPSDLSSTKLLWKDMWSLKVPNRVKTLIWRAGWDSLPLKSNLKKRKIPIDAMCSNCGLEPETSLHAIWSCPSLMQVWNVHFSWLVSEAGKASSFLDVVKFCSERSTLVDLLAMTISQIWTRRNKLRVGEAGAPLGYSLRQAKLIVWDAKIHFQIRQPGNRGIRAAQLDYEERTKYAYSSPHAFQNRSSNPLTSTIKVTSQ
ncbi:hypothetical protein CMV_003110 [Castanea mollissima]|uniref:Reverse transcriptase zinc-binding domain-containing protein n=1 Tax=Castanea mollissima TaxID=60419 RepID=A0A8J4VWG9_9ROSI|nr:hypothetical protein CMV_003110 [Castanea mollissima]